MKRIWILTCLILLPALCFSQGNEHSSTSSKHRKTSPERMEELKSKKIAFFSDKIQLSAEEAQQFWPVYNEYFAKKIELERKKHQIYDLFRSTTKTPISDAAATQATDSLIALNMEESQLGKTYYAKYQTMLPPSKVLKLYLAEQQFSRELIRMIKKGNEPPAPGRNYPPDAKPTDH